MQKYFPEQMIGNKYGKLTVISIEKQNQRTLLNCKCECGNHIIREVYMIGSGVVKSCGCTRTESIKRYNASGKKSKGCYKDGRSLHPLYGTWFQMISRCENPNQNHYDKSGNVVKRYNSLSELRPPFLKKGISNAIYKNQSYKGYIWKYEDE